jgi:hypothetical protein
MKIAVAAVVPGLLIRKLIPSEMYIKEVAAAAVPVKIGFQVPTAPTWY